MFKSIGVGVIFIIILPFLIFTIDHKPGVRKTNNKVQIKPPRKEKIV